MRTSYKKAITAIVTVVLLSHSARALLTDYVFTQVPGEGWGVGVAPGRTNSFCLNTGVYAPVGYYVQKLRANTPGIAALPPTTNVYAGGTNSYCDFPASMGGNGTPPQAGWYTFVGNDDLTWGLSDAGQPGRITTTLDGANAQYGILRLFSAASITGAAYYGDVLPERHLTGGDAFTANPVQTRADQVNPAYKLHFTYYPTNLAGAAWIVTGAVYATAGGHTNQLPSATIKVDWRYSGDTAWTTGSSALGANGQFWFTPSGVTGPTTMYVRACVKDVYCQPGRINLPATTSYLGNSGRDTLYGYGPISVAVAPPPPFVDVTNVVQTVNYNATTTAMGGSNNASVVALWWSNSLTSAGGAVTLGNPWWSINGISLGVGLNTLTVSGTNALGAASSDSVSIARRDVTTGTPFVDVTNAAQTVTYDTATISIKGSNNASVVALWWANNLTSAGGAVTLGNPWWSLSSVSLGVGLNTIMVSGTNALGAASSDSVNITRGDVTTGTPFVDITNGTINADIVVPFAVAGTNNNAVIGLMWVSNAANGQHLYFPASQAWTSAVLNLQLITNIIYVFGSNSIGTVTNDTIVVIGVPEGALLAGLAALAALVARRRLRQRRSCNE